MKNDPREIDTNDMTKYHEAGESPVRNGITIQISTTLQRLSKGKSFVNTITEFS